jgi:putative peptidoglycan lipid II flippase
MLTRMDEQQRAQERRARLEARNARRRAQGRRTWEIDEAWPVAPALTVSEAETIILPPGAGLPPRQPADGAAERKNVARNTAIFGLATALSRVLGLARESVAGYYFGVRGPINAFTVAFQIPNLVRALVADAALSSAFVPVFSELLEKGERKRAWRVASTLFWLMLLGLSGLSALFILVAPWVISPFHAYDAPLAANLSRVLFPIVALLGVSGIVVGILNSYDHFTVPALSPVFWNLAIILGLAIGVPHASATSSKLYVYAGSILVATVVQVLLPMPWLKGRDGRLQLVLDWRDPAVKQVFKLMVPVTLGLGLINVNAVIDSVFASRYIDKTLAPAAISKAFLVYMLPQGMFSVAVATVLFPPLARAAARNDMAEFRRTMSAGLRQIAFLLIPAAAVSAVLAEPIIRILFQRGNWHANQTPVVAGALAAFSLGLFFNGAMLMLNRAFFSLKSNWVPTSVALGNLGLNVVLDAVFYRFGVWGIPLSTSVCNVAGAIALVILLRKRVGRFDGGAILSTIVRVSLASAAVAAVSYVVWHPLDGSLGRSFPAQVVSVGAALLAAVAVYAIACRALRVSEMQTLLSLRSRARRG